MQDVAEQPVSIEGFKYHDSIGTWLRGGGDFKVGGQSVLRQNTGWTERSDSDLNWKQFETVVRDGSGANIKFGIHVDFDSAVAQIGCWPIHGDTGTSAPTFQRAPIDFAVGDQRFGLDVGGGLALHGQGVTIQSYDFDFVTGLAKRTSTMNPREMNNYAPSDVTQTGGQIYMGYRFKDLPIKLLYSWGNYPGNFMHPDGRWVQESDYPRAVLHGGSHFHEDGGEHWIKYTHPDTPWKDRHSQDTEGNPIIGPDRQHLVQDMLVAAYEQDPTDIGIRWLCEAAAHRTLMQFPGWNKGTTHYEGGQARTMGRIRQDLSAFVRGGFSKFDCANRLVSVHANQRAQVFQDIRETGRAWPTHGDSKGWAVAELGIWFAGLIASSDVFRAVDPWAETVEAAKAVAAECFRAFDLSPDGKWRVPYVVYPDGTVKNPDSGGGDFAWFAAVNHKPQNQEEANKLAALKGMEAEIPWRYRGVE